MLSNLDLAGNSLEGEVPNWLSTFSELELLSLGNNNLTGPIPPELGNLRKLFSFYLGGNQLTGEIPSEFAELKLMQYFSLGNNRLSGTIPGWLADLPNLESISLNDNELTGKIPSRLGSISGLLWLHLANNNLTGTIPDSLSNLTQLSWIEVGGTNQLTGCIPSALRQIDNNDFDRTGLNFCEPGETNFVYELDTFYVATIKTNRGDIVLDLFNDIAQVYVENFVNLAVSGFYEYSPFHRVVPDFVIQGGINPDGKTVSQFDDVFHPDMTHDSAGVLSMANAGLNTNTSQFFITLEASPRLDPYANGRLKPCHIRGTSCHAVFGRVTSGMDVVLSIKEGDMIQSIEIRRSNCRVVLNDPLVEKCFEF